MTSKVSITLSSDGLFDLSFVIWLALFSDEVDLEAVEEAGDDERGVDDDEEGVVEGLSSSIPSSCMLGASVDGKVEVKDIKFLSSSFSSFCFLGTFGCGELWSLKPFDFLTTSFVIARFVELVF